MKVNLNSVNTKFVVLGGGTAGWMTALFLRKKYPRIDLTLVESSEIGILGAGEGTTPHVYSFFEELGISFEQLVKHADSTLKNGIKFTNWNGDGNHYFHSFASVPNKDYFHLNEVKKDYSPKILHQKIAEERNLDDISFVSMASEKNKTLISGNIKREVFQNEGFFSLHFNARLLADFLKSVALSRGVKRIDSELISINTDDSGYIKELNLKDEVRLPVDFVFDCSGFKRVIVGKFYQSNWKSYKKHLPVNKAVPFFMDHKENEPLPPYTEAIAMKYGWAWKIPIRTRYGCGYVFDSNIIDVDKAKEEIIKSYGENIKIGNPFSFEAGTYTTPWVKNCLSMGLASGFIEPLEATSIWISIWLFLKKIDLYTTGITHRDECSIKIFNESTGRDVESVMDFIYFHYITKRQDTEFWKNFTEKNEMPDTVKRIYQFNKNFLFLHELLNSKTFAFENWSAVGLGTKFFNPITSNNSFEANERSISIEVLQWKNKLITESNKLVDHKEYINYLYTKK